jgi:flagellar basal-body rod modification protein FlgD
MTTISTGSDLFQSLGLAQTVDKTKDKNLQLQDFLNLMVTELTNQDPFKPMDNTEMATQLSQFATVSGIDQLNQSFSDLAGSLLSDQTLQATNLVGHDVLVPSGVGYYATGSMMNGVVSLDQSASDVVVRVYDAAGSLVRKLDLGTRAAGNTNFSWDGMTDSGTYAPTGYYQVTAQATVGDQTIAPLTLLSARVNSVSIGSSGQDLVLNLDGLGAVSFNDVAEIH